MTLEFHPLANIFPMMTDAEIDDLGDDMLEHGQRKKIMRYEGMILDGRNRYRACLLKGIEPRFVEFMGGEDALAYVISTNLMRRNMTAGQRAMTMAMAYPEPGVHGKRSVFKTDVSSSNLSHARTVLADSRAVAETVLNGTGSLETAYEAVRDRQRAASAADDDAEAVPDEQEEQATAAAADTPADAVKATADRSTVKTPKPVPDVTSAADRAEPTSAAAKPTTPKVDVDQSVDAVGKFHSELFKITDEFCGRLQAWFEAHPEIDDECKRCLTQALELNAGRLQQLAQAIDGRET